MTRRAAILFNPRAGRGKAQRLESTLRPKLEGLGLDVDSIDVGSGEPRKDSDLLIVLGGDGTLHYTLPTALRLDAAIYHAPLGTENLIPREFGLRADPDVIAQAVQAWNVQSFDIGECSGTPFAIMASVGFDAEVIRRVHANRTAKIRHSTYLIPILQALLRADKTPLTIVADGKELVTQTPGLAVIANCRQYGFRFNPAPNASMTDGQLDLVFLPAANSRTLIGWAGRTRLRRHLRHPKVVHAQAKHITLEAANTELVYQMDGEAYKGEPLLDLSVHPRALKLLLAPDAPA